MSEWSREVAAVRVMRLWSSTEQRHGLALVLYREGETIPYDALALQPADARALAAQLIAGAEEQEAGR